MVFKFLRILCRKNQPPAIKPKNVVPPSSESAMEFIMGCSSTVPGETKEGMILNGDHSKFDQYLQAVDEIQQQTESAKISVEDQSKANSTIQIAMAQLENEFRVILISLTNRTGTSHPSKSSTFSSSITDSTLSYGDYDFIYLSEKKKDDLRNIAKRMKSGGCLHKCVEVYKSLRKTFLCESYRKFGLHNVSINDIRSLDWEALEAKIKQWIIVAKICVRNLFANEKMFCEQIFGGLGTDIDDAGFLEVVKYPATQLLTSGKAISICTSSPSRRPEKLFKILDLHISVSEILLDLDIIFQSKSSESIRIQAVQLLMHLTLATREILPQFVTTVLHEQAPVLEYSGSINSLTRYVMSYVTQVTCYERKLNKMIVSKPSKLEAKRNSSVVRIPDMDFPQLDERTPLAIHLIWIIEILQFKLEAKSKCFADASLAQLFMMNNVHYIVQIIEECWKLNEMVGDDYLEELIKTVQRAVTGYQRSTWDKIFHCFRDEGLYPSGSLSSRGVKRALKERLKTFNAMFEEVCQTQASWLVPDMNLRQALRFSISDYLIPAYSSFLQLFKSHIRSGRQQEEYIKYSVEYLEAAISNFFEGSKARKHQTRSQ